MRRLLPLLLLATSLWPGAAATRDPSRLTNNLIVISYDPILRDQGGVRLHRYFKWNDPRTMTTNLLRHLHEASGGYANFRLVDFIEVDAFPVKRDGFTYNVSAFSKCGRTRRRRINPTA